MAVCVLHWLQGVLYFFLSCFLFLRRLVQKFDSFSFFKDISYLSSLLDSTFSFFMILEALLLSFIVRIKRVVYMVRANPCNVTGNPKECK